MRESRMLGSVRAKAEWLHYSTIAKEIYARYELGCGHWVQGCGDQNRT